MNESDDKTPSVVQFKQRQNPDHPPLPVTAKRGWDPRACEHKSTYIDKDKRIVTCQKCDAVLDPITVLWNLANYGMNLDTRLAVIREHEEKEREAVKRKLEDQKAAVPKTIASLKRGDWIRVETKDGAADGQVVSLTDEEVKLDCDGYKTTWSVPAIVRVRVKRRNRA